jgi:hypothetical protein
MIRYFGALATMAILCHAATLRAQHATRSDELPSHFNTFHRKLQGSQTSAGLGDVPFLKYLAGPSGGNAVRAAASFSAASDGHVSLSVASPQDHTLTDVQGQVTTLQLINADTDKVIINLKDKMVIALDAVPDMTSPSFNINALVSGNDVRSVRYGYNGNPSYRTETTAPYAFCGNNKTDFFSCDKLGVGNHSVTVTPRNRKGQAGTSVTVTFTVVETDETKPILVSFKALSPTTVNVTNGVSVNITMEVTFFDESSGFSSGLLAYPDTFPFYDDFPFTFGDVFDFTPTPSLTASGIVKFVVTMRIRPFQRPGTYPLSVEAYDNMFNGVFYNEKRLASLGFPSNITIINSVVDNTLPTVLNFTALTPLKVNTSNVSYPFVDFEVVVKDDLSGVDYGWVRARNVKFPFVWFPCYGEFGKVPSFNTFNHDIFPAGVPVKFRVRLECDTFLPPDDYFVQLYVGDGVRNFLGLNSTDLSKLGFPSIVTLV